MATLASRPPPKKEYVVLANEGLAFDLPDNVVGEERFELQKGDTIWLTANEAQGYLQRGEIKMVSEGI